MQTDILQHALLAAVQIALLALLPILLIVVGTRIINGLRDAWLPWTPYVELGAFAIGVAAGVIVFGKSTDPRLFSPSEVFRVGGFWDMNYIEFLGRNANPFRYHLSALLSLPGAIVILLATVLIAAPIVRFRSPAAISNGIRNVFLTVAGAYVTIYGLAYGLWLLNRLNFLIFLFLMIVIHMRSRSDKVILKLS